MTTKHIWQGPVGIELQPQKTVQGVYFWTFRLKKRLVADDKPNTSHYDRFTMRNAEALGRVIGEAIHFMEGTDPETWLRASVDQQAA